MGENMLSYFKIQENFGENAVALIKLLSKLHSQQSKQKNRRIFLLRCKNEKLTPTFLNIKTNHITFNSVNLEQKFKKYITDNFVQNTLNLLITDTTKHIQLMDRNITETIQSLYTLVPKDLVELLIGRETERRESNFKKIKQKNIQKINRLLQNQKETVTSNHDWIENLTDIPLPDYVKDVLSLGPNFAVPIERPEDIPTPDIITNIETTLTHLNSDEKDNLRSKCCNLITNHKNNFNKVSSNNKEQKKFINKVKKTNYFLKQQQNLKVLKPDKSNKTVVMYECDYDKKMNDLLQDVSTYKELKNDPTNIYQKKNNELAANWENKAYISPVMAGKIKILNAQPPRIYGLPKLHKNGIPLRPIVSCIQSPYENLSKFLKNILQNIINKNKYYIKDSVDLKTKIKNIPIPNNYTLVSLDVVSLYTNVPVELAKDIIRKKWDEIKKYTDIPLTDFLEAIELTLRSTYFMYGRKFYKQIEGCAMGASISSVIAQIVMEHLEETVLNNLTIPIPFFFRYVDDCITALPNDKYNDILNNFNSFHPKLQFTLELEKNNQLCFLDLLLYHDNNYLQTEWYTKETWSSRYLSYNSQHPISQKKSVVIGLADRAIKLSDPKYREHAINKAKEALRKNKYPEHLICNIFKKRIHKFYNENTPKSHPSNKSKQYLSLPYISGLSESLKHTFKQHNVTIADKGHNLLQNSFSKLKSKIPKDKKSCVVYEVPCKDCDSVYIGQTSQYLKNRLNGHKYDKKNKTALTNHSSQNNHCFNFDKTKILRTENNSKKREFYEMIEIQRNPNSINLKTDTKKLSKIYHNLIK